MTKIKPKARAKCSCLKTGLGINSPAINSFGLTNRICQLVCSRRRPSAGQQCRPRGCKKIKGTCGICPGLYRISSNRKKRCLTWPECWLNVSRKSKIPNSGSWWTLNLGKAVKMNENDSGLKLETPRFQAQMSSELQGIWVAKGQEPISGQHATTKTRKATDLSWLSWFKSHDWLWQLWIACDETTEMCSKVKQAKKSLLKQTLCRRKTPQSNDAQNTLEVHTLCPRPVD